MESRFLVYFMGNQITVFMSIKGHKLRLGHGVIAYLDRVIVVRLRIQNHSADHSPGCKGRKQRDSNTGLGSPLGGDTGLKSPDGDIPEALAGLGCRPEQRWDATQPCLSCVWGEAAPVAIEVTSSNSRKS